MTMAANLPAALSLSRAEQRQAFLARIGWGNAECALLAGDASFRKYWRLKHEGEVRVLMDAPPEHEKVEPFVHITGLLQTSGLKVPEIYASDNETGWLLLEDLGDYSYTALLKQHPEHEMMLYEAAIDALLHMREATTSITHQLPPYDMAVYLREVALLTDWFLPQILGTEAALKMRPEYLALWQGLLEKAGLQTHVLVHRDYHADNLLWQPDAAGIARVGMLDYQDALCGDSAYDMVSLLEDARRDITPETLASCLERYVAHSGETRDAFEQRYALLGAQRNAKIIGIFTRLAVRDGKQHYLNYLPRVWKHFEHDLSHPLLLPLHTWIAKTIPQDKRHLSAVDSGVGGIVA